MKNLMNKIRKSNKGFTLVELIIVIAIIAILTVVLAPQYVKYVEKSKLSADESAAATLLQEVEVAIVDAAASGDNITTGGTIVMNNTNTTASSGLDTDITDSLSAADANWTKAKSQRAGKKYTITVTVSSDGDVTAAGEWADYTPAG